jgi:hypothetical protein
LEFHGSCLVALSADLEAALVHSTRSVGLDPSNYHSNYSSERSARAIINSPVGDLLGGCLIVLNCSLRAFGI